MTVRVGIRIGMVAVAAALAATAGCAGSGTEPVGSQGTSTVPTATGSTAGTSPTGGGTEALVGEKLVASKCTRCHSFDRVQKARKTRDGWTTTVRRMQKNGLVVSEGERAAIVEYLTLRDGDR